MRVSRRSKTEDNNSTTTSITNTTNSDTSTSTSSIPTTDTYANDLEPCMHTPNTLKSPLNFQSDTFENDTVIAIPSNQSAAQKSSTRVWRLKKYNKNDANQQKQLDQQQSKSFDNSDVEELTKPKTVMSSKIGIRRLPPRRPKTDKNGNPLEFIFVDASPQQESAETFPIASPISSSKNSTVPINSSPLAQKKQTKFPKNIFRLSSGSKAKAETEPNSEPIPMPIPAPELKASTSSQDLTRSRTQSISSLSCSPLKRSYTSIVQQSRVPKGVNGQAIATKSRSNSSLSMVYIKIDDNGRAVVAQQQDSTTMAVLPTQLQQSQLGSTTSRSSPPPLLPLSAVESAPDSASTNDSPVSQAAPYFVSSQSANSTPYSLSGSDDEQEDENESEGSTQITNGRENDALVAFTKVIGNKRKQLSRKSSTVSINSNFNNMTLTNGTPVASPVLASRPVHQRSLSSLSANGSAANCRRHSPVRSNLRRLKHSQSVSLVGMQPNPAVPSQIYDFNNNNSSNSGGVYSQAGINNKPSLQQAEQSAPQQTIRQNIIQQSVYYPLRSSHSSYSLNNPNSDSNTTRHNSDDSSSLEFGTLGPALDLSSSYTTGSMSSLTTPTSPEHTKAEQNNMSMNHHINLLQNAKAPIFQLQQPFPFVNSQMAQNHNYYINQQHLQQQQAQQHYQDDEQLEKTPQLNDAPDMNKLSSMDSCRTLTSDQATAHQQIQEQFMRQQQQQQQQFQHQPQYQQQQAKMPQAFKLENDTSQNDTYYAQHQEPFIFNSGATGDVEDDADAFDLFDFINYDNSNNNNSNGYV